MTDSTSEAPAAKSKTVFDYFAPDMPRVRARLYNWYAMQEVVATAPLVRPTPDDLEAFAREHPVAAVQADKLTAVGRMSGAAGLAGAITGGAHSWKHNRMVAYLGIGAILGGMTAALVADDIASWVYGTYTFDQMATKQVFNEFMKRRYPDAPTAESRSLA